MATKTTNYKLTKPAGNENADVTIINENMDLIDKALDDKVDKEAGKGLSTNDYTTAEKNKLVSLDQSLNAVVVGVREYKETTEAELEKKVDKVTGKGLSTNDYTTDEKSKLSGIAAGATKNTVVTYNAAVGTSWTSKTGYVQQTVTVSGILATDNPIIDLVTTTADFEAQQEAWGKVFKVTTAANSITLYASEATETAINLQVKVVR